MIARLEGESLYIYPDESVDPGTPIADVFTKPIQIKLDKISGNQVKIAIDAPEALNIAREELMEES